MLFLKPSRVHNVAATKVAATFEKFSVNLLFKKLPNLLMKKQITILTLGMFLTFQSLNAQINFSEHIAPIIFENCTTCHRQGEVAPFALESYEDVAAYASMIKYVTGIRYMPPWKPDREFSEFLGERYLTDEEIQMIADWADDGAPQGDPNLAPSVPNFPDGSALGTPDLVLSFSESFEHQGNMTDNYRVFVLPTGLTEDKEIAAVEVRPGNSKIVHHALVAYDDSGEGQALDDNTPEYGYDGFGGFGVNGVFDKQFPAYVPGQRPRFFQNGLGQLLPAESDLLVQMHYAPFPTNEMDSSSVNIFYKNEPVERYVEQHVMLPFSGVLTNGPFFIPANIVKTFHGIYNVPIKASIMGVAPHMHLLGQDWTVLLISPQGDTTNLVSIPEWDFNWQGSYWFRKFVIAESGSQIHAYATYDNTAENPLNPNNPPQFVSWGEQTTDEMYYLPISYVPYAEGDEDVVFDENLTPTEGDFNLVTPENKMYPVFPNPTGDEVIAGFSLANRSQIDIQVLDLQGRLVKIVVDNKLYLSGYHQVKWNANDLPKGIYLVNVRGEGFTLSEKISVMD
ncbi:MAG: hypothetical protein ACI9XO_003089 [Paraglaciecola sp.]